MALSGLQARSLKAGQRARAEEVERQKEAGISDVTDLTDRNHGLRLVIGIKTGFDAAAVLEQLYRVVTIERGQKYHK